MFFAFFRVLATTNEGKFRAENTLNLFEEDFLQGIYLASVDTTVHVVPFSHHLCSFYIIVGHVHTACIGYLAVDDYDFSVVTVENGMYPRKLQGFVFINLDTVGTDFLEMSFSQRFVVG